MKLCKALFAFAMLSLSTHSFASILYFNDFDGSVTDWSNNATETLATGETVLGRFARNQSTSQLFDFGSQYSGATVFINFDFYEIDSWDKEFFRINANGNVFEYMFRHAYPNNANANQDDVNDGGTLISNVGSGGRWWLESDELHAISFMTNLDSNGQLNLSFTSTLNSNINDESWAIDNLSIEVSEPAVVALFLSAIGFMGFRRFKA